MAAPQEIVRGVVDVSYQTLQRDLFTSGLAAKIGVHAFGVWSAIKSHADFQTGVCWPGMRKLAALCGISKSSVEAAILVLEDEHLLRVDRTRKTNHYVARERLDVRVGARVICTVVVDYIPVAMRERLARLRAAAAGDLDGEDVWAQVELIPGPGMVLNKATGHHEGKVLADEAPAASQHHIQAARELAARLHAEQGRQHAPKK